MVIEFYTPDKDVKEWIVSYVRDGLMKMHQQHREISRAEVYFRTGMEGQAKKCEIDVTIYGDSIKISAMGEHFDEAAKKALAELEETIAINFRDKSEPPDERVSTVKV